MDYFQRQFSNNLFSLLSETESIPLRELESKWRLRRDFNFNMQQMECKTGLRCSCLRMWEVGAKSQEGKEGGEASSWCLRADASTQGGHIISWDLSAMPS